MLSRNGDQPSPRLWSKLNLHVSERGGEGGGNIKNTAEFTTIFIVSPGDIRSARFVLDSREHSGDALRTRAFQEITIRRKRERQRSVPLGQNGV